MSSGRTLVFLRTHDVTFLFVDFAERYSAAILLGDDGEVMGEAICDFGTQSRPPSEEEIIECLEKAEEWARTGTLNTLLKLADHVVIEDVNPFAVNPKPVLRSQGGFLRACALESGTVPRLKTANVWQRYHGYKKKKGITSKGWAKEKAKELGYEAKLKGKAAVDLRDAYLGALWMKETL